MSAQARYGASRRSRLQPLVGGVLVLLDRVPLVQHEHDALPRLEHVAHDVGVLRRVALGRIGHDDRDVGRVDRLHAAQDGIALDPPVDRAPAPDAGRVDEHERLAVELDGGVDRVAGRARHLGHDHPIRPQHPVHERRLAGVRPPHDRDARRPHLRLGQLGQLLLGEVLRMDRCRRLRLARRREVLDDEVGEVTGVAAVLGADRDRGVEAEGEELDRIGLACGVVALVDDEDHRRVGAAQPIGHLVVERRQSGVGVDDEEDRGRPPRSPPAPGPAPAPRCSCPARARGRRCRRR